jgi:Rrf2 family protein
LALQALVGMARHYGRGLVTARELAETEEISEPSLRKVLPALRRAGLVTSERGMRGGHELSRSPEEISVLDVSEALGMFWGKNICPLGRVCCQDPGKCATVKELEKITERLREVLDAQTIAACCNSTPERG